MDFGFGEIIKVWGSSFVICVGKEREEYYLLNMHMAKNIYQGKGNRKKENPIKPCLPGEQPLIAL